MTSGTINSSLGRWFSAGCEPDDLAIDLKHSLCQCRMQARRASEQGKVRYPKEADHGRAFYESHARQYWPGGGKPQEYDSTTFTNNMDSSTATGFRQSGRLPALRPSRLQLAVACRCALREIQTCSWSPTWRGPTSSLRGKVISGAGTTATSQQLSGASGITPSNSHRRNPPGERQFAGDAAPSGTAQAWLRLDHEFNALDNFFYDKQGALQFRPMSPEYPLHATKPDAKR